MLHKIYSGSLALTKLKSALITTKKGNRAILIPIEDNYLIEKDGAAYMPISVLVREGQDQYGQNGFIGQSVSSEKYKELGKDKVKELALPILGNIKDFGESTTDNSGVTEVEGNTDPEKDDDLPF